MKLIYFSNSLVPSRAANSVHVMKMCNAFANSGYKVTLIAKKGNNKNNKNNKNIFYDYGVNESFKLILVPNVKLPFFHLLFPLFSIIYAIIHRPNIIYSRNIYSTFFATILGLKSVYEAHSPETFTNKSRIIFNRLYKNKNILKIVVISNALKNIMISEYGVSNKLLVAHDGADLPILSSFKEFNYFNKNDDSFNAVYVGHLYKGRGIDIIVALAELCNEINFHIVGGTNENIEYWTTKTNHIKNINFYGFITPKETEKFRLNADVLLAPYQNKVAISGGKGDTSKWMSPLKIFEYLSSNTPIICSRISVLEEVLTHNQNSVLCDPENVNEWRNALIMLKEDENMRNRIALEGLDLIKNKYTWYIRAKYLLSNVKN